MEVCDDEEGRINVKASNISIVSVDLSKVSVNKLVISGHNVSVLHANRDAGTLWFERVTNDGSACWKVTSSRTS